MPTETYEEQRKRRIEENGRKLSELGLDRASQAISAASVKQPRPIAPRSPRKLVAAEPTRISNRSVARVDYSVDKAFAGMDGEREFKRRRREGGGRGRAAAGEHGRTMGGPASLSIQRNSVALPAAGEQAYQGERNLPEEYSAHNRSCHVCTQGVCSWRGSFSLPLK